MGLKDLVFERHVVKTSGGEFSVRGLSLVDFTSLFHSHRGELTALFERFQKPGGKKAISLDSASDIGASLIRSSPLIAAEVIAVAATEPGEFDASALAAATSLPLPYQLEALEAVAKLTFTAENPPKKVIAAIVRISGGTMAAMTDLRT
jgi:hypothetical protein